jgi:geranylgeranyl diphosphate synthase type I
MAGIIPEIQISFENYLKGILQPLSLSDFTEYFRMIEYQMGWSERQTTTIYGKRVRPVLMLLLVRALGKEWETSMPAAAALELIHNYSLVHDDIEDKSEYRHGKKTIWKEWGEAQAINTGDAILSMAFQLPWLLEDDYPIEKVTGVQKCLQNNSLELTKGQFLDISFETKDSILVDEYFKMVEGKTGSLLIAAFEVGGILGDASPETRSSLGICARSLGRAYQIQDDWLGIWGDEALTGKSSKSDLLERKKTYPVIIGLQNRDEFFAKWNQKEKFTPEDVSFLAKMLEAEGVKKICEEEFEKSFSDTLSSLRQIECEQKKMADLINYISSLLERKF